MGLQSKRSKLVRKTMACTVTPGEKNIWHKTLVDSKKILLPLLHIKLGIMKQFIKAFPKHGDCLNYFCERFSHLS